MEENSKSTPHPRESMKRCEPVYITFYREKEEESDDEKQEEGRKLYTPQMRYFFWGGVQ